ncbi:uncharacterized protein LOC6580741 isoform X1 [Drosophila mojavensis]|uniref:Uncharacterized protein n=2 Tax=Drosophila mojavensis TaxID=7230 RepID=B4KS43_DROMO|nr:uncharacterized protein LOC6580741 isoform X1 [Drosophila mojavensis]EDW10479.2 uncharacterized protein Dmoj_GI18517 [Drosophila mojavensis]
MPSSLNSLMNRRDCLGSSGSRNSALNLVLSRIRGEVEEAHVYSIIIRQNRMRELYERDMELVRLEMNQLRATQVVNRNRFRSTPLGMVPIAVRYINQIPG